MKSRSPRHSTRPARSDAVIPQKFHPPYRVLRVDSDSTVAADAPFPFARRAENRHLRRFGIRSGPQPLGTEFEAFAVQIFAKEAAGQSGRNHDGGAEAGADVSRLARGGDQAAREGRAQGRLVGPVDRAGRVGERGARVAAVGPRPLRRRWGVAQLRGRRLALPRRRLAAGATRSQMSSA